LNWFVLIMACAKGSRSGPDEIDRLGRSHPSPAPGTRACRGCRPVPLLALIAFLETVVGGPAHLVGHSIGAPVALLVAQRRPDLVSDFLEG
jgi:pimeloyl-ACP methyl ester carboxylesterase